MTESLIQTIMPLMKGGMYLHFVMATLMVVWGVLLLRHRPDTDGCCASRGWLLFVVPCPVCLTVIFLSSSFLTALFPGSVWGVVAIGFGLFFLITLTVAALGRLYLRRHDLDARSALGAVMLGIAAFFILTICMAPHFQSIDEIYRLAVNAGGGAQMVGRPVHSIFYATTAFVLMIGFAGHYLRMEKV